MRDDMGTFRVEVQTENPIHPGHRRAVPSVLVDTGAELSWMPADILESLGIERYSKSHFRQADGSILARWVSAAFLHVAGKRTADDVVFGEPGDLTLLGARSLEGLNFRVEPSTKRLVDAGPVPAAPAAGGVRHAGVKTSGLGAKRAAPALQRATRPGNPARAMSATTAVASCTMTKGRSERSNDP